MFYFCSFGMICQDFRDWSWPPIISVAMAKISNSHRDARADRAGGSAVWRKSPRRMEPSHWGLLIRVPKTHRRSIMGGLIYLVGLIVVILAILSFFGLR
jgi:hypothetical protein